MVRTGTGTLVTYRIDRPCPRPDWDGQPLPGPCRIWEMDHYGQPTGELLCHTHVVVVGTVLLAGQV